MEKDNRTFLRIPTKLRGRLRLLGSEHEPQLFREAPITSSSGTVMELKNAGINEALVNAILNLDRKLDMLIGLHSQDSLQEDFPYTVEVVEISGAGVKLSTTADLAVGQMVELVLVLTQVPVRMSSAIGQVVRLEEIPRGFAWALDFTRIRDRDLESIVQFVFQTQRDELRERKWS
jgi:hypothetical protein